jgi:succinyl-CoA synthetase alpha subunit
VMEAASAGVELIVAISDGIPVNDMLKVYSYMEYTLSRLIGPNCPGLLSVGECKLGIMPNHIFKPGPVGVISRSGTLTYEVVDQLSRGGLGQTTCIGVGGDPIIGTSFLTLLMDFEDDPETECVVIIGEIGGSDEEEAADYIHEMTKPVVAFISGRTAPPGKRMGHAGAIVSGGKGTAESKIAAFQEAGVPVADTIPEIARLCKEKLGIK